MTTADDPVGFWVDRRVLVEILVYHYRTNTSGCGCGWAELGHSHPEHVADVIQECMHAIRGGR